MEHKVNLFPSAINKNQLILGRAPSPPRITKKSDRLSSLRWNHFKHLDRYSLWQSVESEPDYDRTKNLAVRTCWWAIRLQSVCSQIWTYEPSVGWLSIFSL